MLSIIKKLTYVRPKCKPIRAAPKDMFNKTKTLNQNIYYKTIDTLDDDTIYKITHIFQTFDLPVTDHQKKYIRDIINNIITEKELTNDQLTYLIFILKYYSCI